MSIERPAATGTPIDPDALTMASIRAGALRDRPVSVLGFARSGIALARFLADAGARVTMYDGRPAGELGPAIEALGDRQARLLLGPEVEPAEAWAGADLVTSSPSINPDFPTTEPRLRAALGELVARRARGDASAPAVVWEADLFLRLCPAPTVGITGTKGKTTTSALTHAVLAADPGHRAILGGNMGVPIVERLPELGREDRVVFELSELQLPTLSRGTTVALYTNVTADHLDRHGDLASYRRVKRRLAELVDPDGALVLNLDDPVVASYAGIGGARTVPYGLEAPVDGGVGIVDGWIVGRDVQPLAKVGAGASAAGASAAGGDLRIMAVDELAIPGRHNVWNAMAAVATGLLFGVPGEAIRRAAAAFSGVEHRLETVAVVDGIRYVNDSQGTQPDAVVAALRAFEPPVVLIAGGRDKGIDLAALGPVVAERAAAAVLIGESAAVLDALFVTSGLATIRRAGSLEAAVDIATGLAKELAGLDGRATVLLSPAAASFDMFADYEARGRAFKAAVGRLAASAGSNAPADAGSGTGGTR
jgi:UDP-N-acetylmuramoylalanine--D-glutamate ligase